MKQPRRSPLAFAEDALEQIDEAGFGTPILVLAVVVSILLLRHLVGCAHAATAEDGPTPSNLAGFAITLLPLVIALLLASLVFKRPPPLRDEEEAYGDTTRFGERQG